MRSRLQRFKALTEKEKQLVREIPNLHKSGFTPSPKAEYENLPHPFAHEALEELKERERIGKKLVNILTVLLVSFMLFSCSASHTVKSVTTTDHYKHGKLDSKTTVTTYKHHKLL